MFTRKSGRLVCKNLVGLSCRIYEKVAICKSQGCISSCVVWHLIGSLGTCKWSPFRNFCKTNLAKFLQTERPLFWVNESNVPPYIRACSGMC